VVGRESSVRALEYALANDQKIFLATQHDANIEGPQANQISQFGCVCKVLQNVKMPNGNVKVLVEGMEMAKTIEVNESRGFYLVTLRSVNTNVGVA
jgi:ATP-dependent Lon protease